MNERKYILSELDIEALLHSSKDVKLEIVKKIGKYYTAGSFSKEQQRAAEKIISAVVRKETDEHVRQAMSESIKDSDNIPNEIVMYIAEDVAIVAVPILQFSNVLTDDNLVYIIQNTDDVEKEKSISQRESLSKIVSSALIDKRHEPVIITLLSNKGAKVSEDGYKNIIKSFSEKQVIMERLIQRPNVPINIVRMVSEKLVPSNQNETEECKHDYEFNHFAKKALENGIKREMLPIYALCKGSLNFFELAVARQICVPVVNIRKLLENGENSKKFDIIYERVKLPSNLHDATKVLYLVLKEFTEDNIDSEKGDLKESDAKRIINNMFMLAEEMGYVENMEYLVSLIKGGIK